MKQVTAADYQQYERLIYKMAWSFHNTSGIDVDELISEGNLAFCQAAQSFNPALGNFKNYVITLVKSYLIEFCKKEQNWKFVDIDKVGSKTFDFSFFDFDNIPQNISNVQKRMIKVILENQERFTQNVPKKLRGEVVQLLREQGWAWSAIWNGLRERL